MKLRTFLCLLALLPSLASRGAETLPAENVPEMSLRIEAADPGMFDPTTLAMTYTRDVLVKYGSAVLMCDKLVVNPREQHEVLAEGNVVLIREGGQVWRGELLRYNFKTRVMNGSVFRTGQPPFFASGESFITDPIANSYIGTNITFTTDDHPYPNYHIRAKKVAIIPGKSIEARNAVLYFGDVPVFYFPYYHKNLGRHEQNFEFTPGFRSSWGPFLLSSYNWYLNPHLHGSLNLDLRGRRGVAGGPDLWFAAPNFGETLVRYYITEDQDPRSKLGFDKTPDTRQRLWVNYLNSPVTNLTLKGVLAYQSDPLIIRDFFESEYHDNVQPKSFFEVDKQFPNWSIDLLTQARANDFQETVERLPDLKITGLRQQIGPTPLYYESESSMAYLRHIFPDIHTNRFYPARTNAYAATRGDTFHQILLPWTFFGFLNVTPRAGQRVTYYSEAEGRGTTLDEETRTIFNTGAEVTMKASRVYRQAQSELLEVNGLRHIIQPSVNYVFIPDPDVRPREVPQFDTELPSSRLLPITFPEYNAIDAIDSQQAIRFGLWNKVQTKREDGLDYLLNWNVYGDWRLTPHHGQRGFSDVYSDMDFKPRSWLTFSSETRYSILEGQFREANHLMTIQPNETWSVQLGHLYRDTTPELGLGNNLIRTTLFYRLNENWGFRTSHYFEARDGVLEYQYYTVYRDFRSWTGALTLRFRENHSGSEDYTIAFTFSLKASPRLGVGSDVVRPQRLIGG